jgi:hypothetical protein
VSRGEIMVSLHGLEELQADGIRIRDVMAGLRTAKVVEDYPDYSKGPCVPVLQHDSSGEPIHIVWGIPKAATGPTVIVTGYRPYADRWSDDFLRRRP